MDNIYEEYLPDIKKDEKISQEDSSSPFKPS